MSPLYHPIQLPLFYGNRPHGRPKGSRNGQPTLVPIICERCGKTFYRKPSAVALSRYCSNECNYAPQFDEETLRYLYETERLTQKQIAERLEVDQSVISHLFERYGIKRLPKSTLASTPHCRPDYETVYRLYETERLTTRHIGKMFGVSKTEVLRWLKFYNIPCRAAGRGLLNRGIKEPTKEELIRFVHEEHRSYREIGEMYSVSFAAVEHWLERHHIECPTVWETRRKGVLFIYPSQEELHQMYIEKGMTLAQIAAVYDVSQSPIKDLCKKFGIPLRPDGFNGGVRFLCNDGHLVRSTYEQKVDNWLYEHDIPHEYEPRLPCDRRYDADFLANGWYIEVWGVNGSKEYAQRKARKISLYCTHQIPLIQLSIDSFQPRRKGYWKRCLARCLTSKSSQIPIEWPRT